MSSVGLPPNNGVAVRGVHLVRSFERRRLSWWKTGLATVLFFVPDFVEDEWCVITVHGTDGALASRRFEKRREAEDARARLAREIEAMTGEQLAAADWQHELDTI